MLHSTVVSWDSLGINLKAPVTTFASYSMLRELGDVVQNELVRVSLLIEIFLGMVGHH